MSYRFQCRRGARAFTLIELMIVVAIIALLIAILLPSLSRAREQAKSVKCQANLKEIFNGIFYYTNDNNGAIPNFGENFIGRAGGFWSQQIRKYIPDSQVYLCPTDLRPVWEYLDEEVLNHGGDNVVPGRLEPGKPTRETASTGSRRRGGGGGGSSQLGPLVAPNSYIGNCNTWLERNRPRNINHFKFPHFFVVLVEGDRGGGGSFESRSRCFEFVKDLCPVQPNSRLFTAYGWRRHMGGSNYLFIDGHSEHLKPLQAAPFCQKIEFVDFGERRDDDPASQGGTRRGR